MASSTRSRTFIGIAAVLTALATAASASAFPTWQPVVMTSAKNRVLSDEASATVSFRAKSDDAAGSATTSIEVPYTARTRRAVRSVLVTATSDSVNGGKPFPLARARVTLTFTLLQQARDEKIWSSNFDRYFNVCVKEGKDVTASGGLLYCELHYPEKMRVRAKARITNFPRPQLIAQADVGAKQPACVPGTTKTEAAGRSDDAYGCRDSAGAQPVDRTLRTTSRVWTGKNWVESASDTTTYGPGPAWIQTGSTPLPPPTIQVSDVHFSFGVTWRFTATVTCSYRGNSCPYIIHMKRSDGTWGNAFPDAFAIGRAGPYTKTVSGDTYECCGVTPLPEARMADEYIP
jgi:hypothetical protein